MSRVLFCAGLFITDRPERWAFVFDAFDILANTFKQLGVETSVVCHPCLGRTSDQRIRSHAELRTHIDFYKPDYLFIWNGGSPGDLDVKRIALEYGVKAFFHGELAWFPQAGHCYFDKQGVNAASSFNSMEFTPLTEEEEQERERFRWNFAESVGAARTIPAKKESGYTGDLGVISRCFNHHLIALQDESDTNMINSRFSCMAEFVEEAIENIKVLYGNDQEDSTLPILVRPHPHQPSVVLPNQEFEIDRGNLYESIMSSYSVHSINSTVLLESAMLGVSVVPYCDGIMRRGIKPWEIKPLLYQLMKRQLRGVDLYDAEKMRSYPIFQEIFD